MNAPIPNEATRTNASAEPWPLVRQACSDLCRSGGYRRGIYSQARTPRALTGRRGHDFARADGAFRLLFARVAAEGCPPAAPTDPDVQNSRIRLFRTRIRYAG